MHVVCGLGNPGKKYQLTRHNVGFLLLDYIQSIYKIPFRPGKGDYYFCEIPFTEQPLLLVKPTTFMNRSGLAVDQIFVDFNVDISDILIVYDDFHLPFGSLRFRAKGSAGGHNGIASIISVLGTQNFDRLRIGIGYAFEDAIEFVLSNFTRNEIIQLQPLLNTALDGIKTWFYHGIDKAMNDYNSRGMDSGINNER